MMEQKQIEIIKKAIAGVVIDLEKLEQEKKVLIESYSSAQTDKERATIKAKMNESVKKYALLEEYSKKLAKKVRTLKQN